MPLFRPLVPCCLLLCLIATLATGAAAAEFPKDFAAFQADLSPAIFLQRDTTPKHYRQIEPSLFHSVHSAVPAEGMSGEVMNWTWVGLVFQRQTSSTSGCPANSVAGGA